MPTTNSRKAGRHDSTWRNRWIRDYTTQLIVHEAIKIEEAKAKELRRHIEPLITMAKKGTLADRRRAAKVLRPVMTKDGKKTALQKLFEDIGPRFKDRQGGYTRILKVDSRQGDNSEMAIIEILKK